MPEILNLELNPREGAVRSTNSPVTNPISNEVLKKSVLNKAEQTNAVETPISTNSGANSGSGGGEAVSRAAEEGNKAQSNDKTMEVADKQTGLENDPRMQAVAKREREFRAREANVKQMLARRENELNARMAKFEADQQDKLSAIENFNGLADNAKKNPEPYLRFVFGDNWYDNAVQFKLNGRPIPELVTEQIEDKFSQEMRQLREEREAERLEREKERQQQQAYWQQQEFAENNQTINHYFSEVENYIKQKPETFELITMQGKPALQLVNQLVEANFYQTGQLFSPQEAAEKVEKYLTDQYMSYSKAKKFAPRETVSNDASTSIENKLVESRPTSPNPGARTLTNQMTVSTPSVMTSSNTERDRIKRALAAMDAVESKR